MNTNDLLCSVVILILTTLVISIFRRLKIRRIQQNRLKEEVQIDPGKINYALRGIRTQDCSDRKLDKQLIRKTGRKRHRRSSVSDTRGCCSDHLLQKLETSEDQ